VRGAGAGPVFPPLAETEAAQIVNHLLHQTPYQHGIARSRWRLQDVARALHWLQGYSEAGIYKVLKRLGFSRKQALRFIYSPDPNYRAKWQRVLQAYQEALTQPEQVVLLFQDEFTYYRRATLRQRWQKRGAAPQRHYQATGSNTQARITATLNALTGQVLYLQRRTIGKMELATFYAHIRQAYAQVTTIYLVQDNWPVHYHPIVNQAAQQHRLTRLFLPTYASWLNPIEKLWRWLRQAVLHDHDEEHTFKQLRQRVESWFAQFAARSLELLLYVGILTRDEIPLYQY
jgi:DDE superfamily endonuclease/Winged helix-turn helix